MAEFEDIVRSDPGVHAIVREIDDTLQLDDEWRRLGQVERIPRLRSPYAAEQRARDEKRSMIRTAVAQLIVVASAVFIGTLDNAHQASAAPIISTHVISQLNNAKD